MNQQQAWEDEHRTPHHLVQMDSRQASSGVIKFYEWLQTQKLLTPASTLVEMGCGKGRNTHWLQQQGLVATGFDFSAHAIKTAQERFPQPEFTVADATQTWPWPDNNFDYGLDCFALTDVDSLEGRAFAVNEFARVIKPGGYLCAYLMSDEDQYHQQLITKSPVAEQPNAFLNPAGKFEKVFSETEIKALYQNWEIVAWERVKKQAKFHGKIYDCKHHWLVLQNK